MKFVQMKDNVFLQKEMLEIGEVIKVLFIGFPVHSA